MVVGWWRLGVVVMGLGVMGGQGDGTLGSRRMHGAHGACAGGEEGGDVEEEEDGGGEGVGGEGDGGGGRSVGSP